MCKSSFKQTRDLQEATKRHDELSAVQCLSLEQRLEAAESCLTMMEAGLLRDSGAGRIASLLRPIPLAQRLSKRYWSVILRLVAVARLGP
jgi:hypothetical protein